MVRKVGSEYRLFYGEALINTTSAIAAGAMTGLYWGPFSTLAANNINSFRADDTGNVTGWWDFLNRYTFDDLSFLKQQIAPDSYWMPEVANG
jgi:hypothetical protein